MASKQKKQLNRSRKRKSNLRDSKTLEIGEMIVFIICLLLVGLIAYAYMFPTKYDSGSLTLDGEASSTEEVSPEEPTPPAEPKLDKADYDARMLALANHPAPEVITITSTTTDGEVVTSTTTKEVDYDWPVEGNPYPNPGAILPFHRVVAYYGNFYSTKMGVLGEYEPDVVLAKLKDQVRKWELADPDTPVIPAIDYIAVTAQASAGADGDYNLRMPDDHIEKAIRMAKKVDGIVFLEVQVGLGDLQNEIHLLSKYLKMPEVHLAIDPEFNMKRGNRPGEYIGTVDATDVNKAAEYLAKLVRENDLPPKILVVHRFTPEMVTHAENIHPLPEVQIVMDMDGWGSKAKKRNTYLRVIRREPVQFTGFKVFYKNDLKAPSTGLMTPKDILELRPRPIFIQYQ